MFGPRSSTSPSSAIFTSTPANGLPTDPKRNARERVAGGRRGGLRHAVALHDRNAAGVEELEDLLGDRSRAGDALPYAAAEDVADVHVQLLVRLIEGLRELGGHLLAALSHRPDLDAELNRLVQQLDVVRARAGQRVDLLEDPRDGGEVGRLHLHEVGDDLLGVLLPVRDDRAEVERHELDQQGERVRKREEEVAGLALLEHVRLRLHRVAHRAVVAVREDYALRRPGRAGGVDEDARVVGRDARDALVELGLAATAAALSEIVELDRVADLTVRLHHDHELERGQVVLDLADLRQLLAVLHEHGARLRVLEHVVALLGRVRLVDRHRGAAGREDAEVGVRPLGASVREDRDAVAAPHPQVDQPASDLAHGGAELRVVDVDPLVADLVPQRRVPGVPLRGNGGKAGHRRCARGRVATGRRAGRACFHSLLQESVLGGNPM